jgi:hypothetical protein
VAALSLSCHVVAIVLSYAALMKAQRGYRLRLQWQRHKRELQLNDPERTTMASSQSEMSVSNSIEMLLATLANTKLHSKADEESSSFHSKVLTEDNKIQKLHFTYKEPSHTDQDKTNKKEGYKTDDPSSVLPHNPPIKNEQDRKRFVVDPSEDRGTITGSLYTGAYAISLNDTKKHNNKLHKFKSTISLEATSARKDQQSVQFVKMLFLFSCISLIGWCPSYIVTVLSLFKVNVPGLLGMAVNWLCYLRPVLCPVLYPICCNEYRQAIQKMLRKIRLAIVPSSKGLSERQHVSVELGEYVDKSNSVLSENKNVVLNKISS